SRTAFLLRALTGLISPFGNRAIGSRDLVRAWLASRESRNRPIKDLPRREVEHILSVLRIGRTCAGARTHKSTTMIDVRLAPTSAAKPDISKPPLRARSGHSGRSKFLQVLGNEHWARKVLLHLVRPSRIIIVRFPRQMAQDHGLYSGARGYLPNILRAEMPFGHLSLDARLLLGCHDLPLPRPDPSLHSLLNGICL